MSTLWDTAEAFFASEAWPTTPDVGKDHIRTVAHGRHGKWPVTVRVDEARGAFDVAFTLPDQAPRGRQEDLGILFRELRHRGAAAPGAGPDLGRGQPWLRFSLIRRDGSVGCLARVHPDVAAVDPAYIGHVMQAALAAVDEAVPTIMAVLYAGMAPADALEAARLARTRDEEASIHGEVSAGDGTPSGRGGARTAAGRGSDAGAP